MTSNLKGQYHQARFRTMRLSNPIMVSYVSQWKIQNIAASFAKSYHRAVLHDVTAAAILMFQNNETAAMLVSQTNRVGVEPFSCGNTFFRSDKFCVDAGHMSENTLLFRLLETLSKRV